MYNFTSLFIVKELHVILRVCSLSGKDSQGILSVELDFDNGLTTFFLTARREPNLSRYGGFVCLSTIVTRYNLETQFFINFTFKLLIAYHGSGTGRSSSHDLQLTRHWFLGYKAANFVWRCWPHDGILTMHGRYI